MTYLQLRGDMTWPEARPLNIGDVAYILPRDANVTDLAYIPAGSAPNSVGLCAGEHCITALDVISQIRAAFPNMEFELLGTSQMWVSVDPPPKPNGLVWLREVIVFILLLFGSALAITFFHADVDMQNAQINLMHMLTGRDTYSQLELALPYSLGVLAGVGGFFLIGGKRKSPLAVKLCAYRQQVKEQRRNDGD